MSYPTFTPRHIIFVICDDLAFGDLSCHGNPHCQTLNLDHIHNQSRRMTGYRSGPLCTPARACLMTGRNHLRTGAFDTYIGRSTLHPDEITLAQLLQQSGYHTGLFGKWHLGDVYPARPMDKGFDEAFWHGGGGIGQQGDVLGNSYFNPVFNHNGKPQQTHGYCTDVIFDQAIDWISDHARQQTFTYIAPNCPHTPLQVPESWIEPFRQKGINETHARIYAMVKNIDDAMGRLMQRLDELELTENTMLVFTSDHGPCGSASHEGQHRFNAGLRGIKGSMYEGGLHVPCFIRWPQAFDAGDDNQLASPMDWMPTLAGPCGFDLPTDRVMDGHDWFAGTAGLDRQLILQWHRGNKPIKYQNYCVIQHDWKLTRPDANAPDELYKMPDETKDWASENQRLVTVMRQAYEHWFDTLTDERGDQTFAPVPLVLGHPAQPVVDLTWQDWRTYDPNIEGWDYDKPGYWTVQIDQDGIYHMDIITPLLLTPCTLHVRCGNWQCAIPINSPLMQYHIDYVHLTTGCKRFEAYIESLDKPLRLGVKRVTIAREEPSKTNASSYTNSQTHKQPDQQLKPALT